MLVAGRMSWTASVRRRVHVLRVSVLCERMENADFITWAVFIAPLFRHDVVSDEACRRRADRSDIRVWRCPFAGTSHH